ncbi:MAG: TolC family protein [Gammaproteobacteria bacterium]|nr:TolC family protein [Gammaproteobacteria bacterium]
MAQPKELTDEEVSRRAAEDLEFLDNFGEPLTEPLTLSRAMARALKYNLDYRLEWSKGVLAETDLNLSRYELLPDFVAQAGFTSRSNFSGASSRSLITGEESLEFSTSQDRDIFNANLELSWNVLDFGISYYRAKQGANEVLIAEEEKRKVIHRLLQNVRTAYWRAVAAKRLEPRLTNVKTEVAQALARSREISDNNLDDPLQSLRYRRELIDIKRQVEELEENFRMARIQLASLMSIRDPSQVDVVVPPQQTGELELEHTLEELEQKALRQRPEIRQVDYRKRNAEHAARAALMDILPVPRLHVSQNHNDNSFLFNNDWLIAGAQVSWNLLRFVRYPAAKRKTDAEQQALDARSLTLSMAILTQVKVSMAQFLLSSKQFETQTAHMEVQSLIDNQVEAMASTRKIGKQTRIREAMNTLLAEIRYNVAWANLQKSHANLLMAAGLDPRIDSLESRSLDEIERVLKENWPDSDIGSALEAGDDSVSVVEAEAGPVSIVSSDAWN